MEIDVATFFHFVVSYINFVTLLFIMKPVQYCSIKSIAESLSFYTKAEA